MKKKNSPHTISMSITPTNGHDGRKVLKTIKEVFGKAPKGTDIIFKPTNLKETSLSHIQNCIRTAKQYGATTIDVGKQTIPVPARDFLIKTTNGTSLETLEII